MRSGPVRSVDRYVPAPAPFLVRRVCRAPRSRWYRGSRVSWSLGSRDQRVARYRSKAFVAIQLQMMAKRVSQTRFSPTAPHSPPSKPARAATTAQFAGFRAATVLIQPGIRVADIMIPERKVIGRIMKFIAARTVSCRLVINAIAFEIDR